MTVRKTILAVLAFCLVAGVALAHNGMIHVIGTIAKITAADVTVSTTDGKTQVVVLTADTKYLRGTAVAAQGDVKVGDRVVIHAVKKGDQLVAAEVKVGAATPVAAH